MNPLEIAEVLSIVEGQPRPDKVEPSSIGHKVVSYSFIWGDSKRPDTYVCILVRLTDGPAQLSLSVGDVERIWTNLKNVKVLRRGVTKILKPDQTEKFVLDVPVLLKDGVEHKIDGLVELLRAAQPKEEPEDPAA